MYPMLLDINESCSGSPENLVYLKEFVKGLHKVGSLISMLENKKINSTTLFTLLLENEHYRRIFIEITSSENFKDALSSMLYFYPNLVKSKFTKLALKKLHARPINRV